MVEMRTRPATTEDLYAAMVQANQIIGEQRARIAELEALLREADRLVVWETAMPSGRIFQERVEKALKVIASPGPA